jgi:Spy/CpxP family protein refolding chaperone
MRRFVVLSVLAAGLLTWGAMVPASEASPGEGWSRGPHMLAFPLKGLGLTEAQRAQVRQIFADHRPQLQALAQQLREARQQLAGQMVAPTVDQAALEPLVQRIAQLREQLGRERLQVALAVRGVLTPEQLARAAQVQQRLGELRSEMRQLLRSQP